MEVAHIKDLRCIICVCKISDIFGYDALTVISVNLKMEKKVLIEVSIIKIERDHKMSVKKKSWAQLYKINNIVR